jgi:CDP-glucose 4,6-dehydratase
LSYGFWKDKRIFVTGCAGLLGSWLAAELIEQGASVVGLLRDRAARSQLIRSGNIDKIDLAHGDVCDYALMERIIAEYEIDTIFHLAAQTTVGIANRSPLSTFETNIRGTWMVLEAARRNPTVKRILVASSDQAYGTHSELPYDEQVPLQAEHPYGVSKSCVDLIARTYFHTYGLPVVVTRCVNLYGGGDLNWNRLVPGTMRSLLQGQRPLVRSDGTLRRDYIFVLDAVCGYLMAGEQMGHEDVCGQAFNFGVDQPISVLDMINRIIEVSGTHNLAPIILNEAENEIQEQFLSSAKANQVLGWRPQHTLESGLAQTFAWYQRFLAQD